MIWAEWVSTILVVAGSFFCVVGGLGLLIFPDFYTRIHAAGVTDTGGAGLLLIGLMFHAGWSQVTVKLALVLVFLLITGPTASHALVKAAYARGLRLRHAIPDRASDPDAALVAPASSLVGEESR